MKNDRYNPSEIESKWRKIWEKEKTFQVDLKKAVRPFYNLMMFPYPSGEGLHVGHVYAFGGSDTYGRFKRLKGFDVFEPMGFDSFGIHSENYAIKENIHPKKLIEETTTYFREKQLKRLGALFDWDHQVITSDPDYYRWTQWIFIQLFKAGLAIRKEAPVDWCPSCKTVLADEQVIGGRCERCSCQVVQRELEQWFFKITNYAERLLRNLDCLPADVYGPKVKLDGKARQAGIDWSETTKTMQRNWIGRSEGAIIRFPVARDQRPGKTKSGNWSLEAGDYIEVFTTRPDTIYGATFMVLAPEHPLIESIKPACRQGRYRLSSIKKKEIDEYTRGVKSKTEIERTTQSKTGIFTGLYCLNPFTKKEIPIWIADYVLGSYGTGAIMAVPAHDARDYEFAKTHDLPIVPVIKDARSASSNKLAKVYEGDGVLINSGEFSGLDSKEAIQKISEYIEKNKLGKKAVNYHLRDWLISRQRYWGPPIPMIYCEACAKKGRSWFTTEEAKFFAQKFQAPNNNDQTNSKAKAPNNKKFGIWNLEFDNSAQMRGWPRQQRLAASMAGWYPVSEKDLPVALPYLKDYQPKGAGVSPLATLPNFVNVKCPECGKNARRETDVSDTFLDSSWYFLRYPSVKIPNSKHQIPNKERNLGIGNWPLELSWDPQITRRWLPVDMYIGGNEHAVLHLLYTRFMTAVLHDLGYLPFEEPFKKFRAHGLIIHGGAKMSKSRGNVVNPNDYTQAYGTDSLRMYLLFIGPYDQGGDFSDRAIAGVHRFLKRVYQTVIEISPPSREAGNDPSKTANNLVAKEINKLIKKVEGDVEDLKFNTAIAALMEFANFATKNKSQIDLDSIKKYLIILSIFAPFTAEELWRKLGSQGSVHQQSWPAVEEKFLQEEKVIIPVQLDGRLRDTIEIENEKLKMKNEIERVALASEKIKKHLGIKKIKKTIYVPGKILNIVTEK